MDVKEIHADTRKIKSCEFIIFFANFYFNVVLLTLEPDLELLACINQFSEQYTDTGTLRKESSQF